MAKAVALCKCEHCGEEFTAEKYCRNSTDVNSFENWAKENYTCCKKCYVKQKKEESEREKMDNLKKVEGLGLPELQGTEKQIKYASDLRAKVLKDIPEEKISIIKATIEQLKNEENKKKIESVAKEQGKTFEEFFSDYLKQMRSTDAYFCFTEISAKNVIERFK